MISFSLPAKPNAWAGIGMGEAEPRRPMQRRPQGRIFDLTNVSKIRIISASFRGEAEGREPGIHNPRLWLWIPGSPTQASFSLRKLGCVRRPGMTEFD